MKPLFTFFTAILASVLATGPLRAQQPLADPQGAASSNGVDDRALKLKVPGKVEAVFLFRQKESLDVSLRLAANQIGMPEPQLREIEVWLLKSDGTVFPHPEKPKRGVSYFNGDTVPILSYAFPTIEKSDPVALVMQVDGEFSVEKLTPSQSWRDWMYLMGEKLGCYFTFERYRTDAPA